MNLEAILENIKNEAGLTDPAQIELLARTITRTAELTTRKLAGEDVEEELAIVKATALNLSAHVRNVAFEHALSYVHSIVTGVLTRALVG